MCGVWVEVGRGVPRSAVWHLLRSLPGPGRPHYSRVGPGGRWRVGAGVGAGSRTDGYKNAMTPSFEWGLPSRPSKCAVWHFWCALFSFVWTKLSPSACTRRLGSDSCGHSHVPTIPLFCRLLLFLYFFMFLSPSSRSQNSRWGLPGVCRGLIGDNMCSLPGNRTRRSETPGKQTLRDHWAPLGQSWDCATWMGPDTP